MKDEREKQSIDHSDKFLGRFLAVQDVRIGLWWQDLEPEIEKHW